MEIIGIISKNKMSWIREYLPTNAIVTTKDIKYIYVPCERGKRHTLSRYSIKGEYKLCKIENDTDIKYVNTFHPTNWIEIKDQFIHFSIKVEKLDYEFMLKIMCCQLFRLLRKNRMCYIKDGKVLTKVEYTPHIKRTDTKFVPKYRNVLIIIELIVVLLLLKWIQEMCVNGSGM
jgi:hypothetical protein